MTRRIANATLRAAEIRRLRDKIAKLPEEEPTAEEIVAILEICQGNFVTLAKLGDELGRRGQQRHRKKP